ncbi:MAG: hypothetical protein AAFY60_08940, partial [Myxococcota bacterium]
RLSGADLADSELRHCELNKFVHLTFLFIKPPTRDSASSGPTPDVVQKGVLVRFCGRNGLTADNEPVNRLTFGARQPATAAGLRDGPKFAHSITLSPPERGLEG